MYEVGAGVPKDSPPIKVTQTANGDSGACTSTA